MSVYTCVHTYICVHICMYAIVLSLLFKLARSSQTVGEGGDSDEGDHNTTGVSFERNFVNCK